MRRLSCKTAKQTCGSSVGSLCGSRTEAMQKKTKINLTDWRPEFMKKS